MKHIKTQSLKEQEDSDNIAALKNLIPSLYIEILTSLLKVLRVSKELVQCVSSPRDKSS